jgi:hypothetical protein
MTGGGKFRYGTSPGGRGAVCAIAAINPSGRNPKATAGRRTTWRCRITEFISVVLGKIESRAKGSSTVNPEWYRIKTKVGHEPVRAS